MRLLFLSCTTGLLLICCVHAAQAQRGGGPEFYNCSNSPISLCVNDPGVRLPADNQFYLGEGDPNASSCSVHFTEQVQIHTTCSNTFQYKLEVSYYDNSPYVELLSWTQGETDDHDEAILSFDTENSTNTEVKVHGLPYTLECARYHRLRWTVMDTCGNSNSCDKRIELYDCHAPVPLAGQGMHVLDFHGGYQLIANLNDFAGSYLDDCASSSQFLFSIRNNAYITDTLFEYCDVPAFGVLVFIPFWVADEGRDLNCNGSISWDERNKYSVSAPVIFTSNGTQDCSDTTLFIYGSIKTVLGEGIAKTHVTIADAVQSYPEVITNDTGYYAFPHYDFTYPVTVTPVRHDGFRNGVNTLDLVKIQKHLLGIDRFTQPYQFIAADANNSASISAIDLVVLRKLILGLTDTLPGNKSWRFFDTLPGGADYQVIASESKQANIDFTGVKIGDVNLSADPNAITYLPRSVQPDFAWTTNAADYSTNNRIEIPIRNASTASITGFQFTLSDPDLEFLGIRGGSADINSDDYAIMGDQMTVSWFSVSSIAMSEGQLMMTILARAKTKGNLQHTLSLDSRMTPAEVYGADKTIYSPKLDFFLPAQDQMVLYPCEPNPWKESCVVPIFLSEAGKIRISVFDLTGKMVMTQVKEYEKGFHEIQFKRNDFSHAGLMMYSIESDNNVNCGKMLISE